MPDKVDMEAVRNRLRPVSLGLEDEPGSPPVAAVAIIIDPNEMGGSILLIRRVEREGDPWSGQVAFPGGHKSSQDKTFLATSIREANEEVGIQLHDQEVLGMLPVMESQSKRVRVAPFVFQLKKSVSVQSNQEVAAHFWVPLDELSTTKVTKHTVDATEGRFTSEAYVYQGHIIWGLTFRILNVLLGRS